MGKEVLDLRIEIFVILFAAVFARDFHVDQFAFHSITEELHEFDEGGGRVFLEDFLHLLRYV